MEKSFLVGVVKGAQVSAVRLNLRSTVFVENDCSCVLGRKGKICAHSIAVCLHYQALQREADLSAQAGSTMESADAVASDLDRPELQSIQLSDEGEKLRVLVFLPPNLEEAAERNAIVVENRSGNRSLNRTGQPAFRDTFIPSARDKEALLLLESWCDGRLAGLLELTKVRLVRMLSALQGEPVIYWLKKPGQPILWQSGQLQGVHQFLKLTEEEITAAKSTENNEQSRRPDTRPQLIERPVLVREKSKPNRRRMIESQAGGLFRTIAADYPSVQRSDPMADYPENRIVVDGSSKYLAIRLPREDDSIAPLRQLLKSEGFFIGTFKS